MYHSCRMRKRSMQRERRVLRMLLNPQTDKSHVQFLRNTHKKATSHQDGRKLKLREEGKDKWGCSGIYCLRALPRRCNFNVFPTPCQEFARSTNKFLTLRQSHPLWRGCLVGSGQQEHQDSMIHFYFYIIFCY